MTKERIKEALKETNKWWKNQFELDYKGRDIYNQIKKFVATKQILALEVYFVHSGRLEEKYVKVLEKARLEKDYVEKLRVAKQERVIAQYNVSVDVEKRTAKWILETAKEFVDRMEKLFEEIKIDEKNE